jgi:hypothetical protein
MKTGFKRNFARRIGSPGDIVEVSVTVGMKILAVAVVTLDEGATDVFDSAFAKVLAGTLVDEPSTAANPIGGNQVAKWLSCTMA